MLMQNFLNSRSSFTGRNEYYLEKINFLGFNMINSFTYRLEEIEIYFFFYVQQRMDIDSYKILY